MTARGDPERAGTRPVVRGEGWGPARITLLLALSAMAAVANLVPVSLMFGVQLLPGTALFYVVLLQWGTRIALVAALPGLLVVARVLLEPVTALLLGVELIIVGLLLRRFRSIEFPLIVALVWVPAGTVLSYLAYQYGLSVSASEARLQSLGMAFNAIAGAAVAVVLVTMMRARTLGSRATLSISDVLFFVPTLMVISVSAVLLQAVSHAQLGMMERQFSERLLAAQRSLVIETEQLLNSLDRELAQISELCFPESRAPASSWLCVSRLLPLSEWVAIYFRPDEQQSWQLFGRSEWLRMAGPDRISGPESLWAEPSGAWEYQATEDGELYYMQPSNQWPGAMIGGVADLSVGGATRWLGAAGRSERFTWIMNGQALVSSGPPVSDNPAVDANFQKLTDDMSASVIRPEAGQQVGQWRGGVYTLDTTFASLGLPLPGLVRLEVSPETELIMMDRVFSAALIAVVGLLLITLLLSAWIAGWLRVPMRSLVQSAQRIPEAVRTQVPPSALYTRLPVVELNELQSSLSEMHRLLRRQYQLERDQRNRLSEAVAERTHELESAYRHITNILDSMDGVLWAARRGSYGPELELVSQGVEAMTGYSPAQWQRNTARLLTHVPRSERGMLADHFQTMMNAGSGEFEVAFRHRRGDTRQLRLRYWPVTDNNGHPVNVAGLVVDITAWVEAQDKIRAQEELLVHQSRRAAMGEIVSNVAHQWRQPLNSIRLQLANVTDALDHDDLTPAYLRDSLEQCDALIRQMNQTVRNFLTYFRPGREPEEFELSQLLESACDIAGSGLDDFPVEIALDVPGNVWVHGFPNEMLQALLVVLQNAREAIERKSPARGCIEVTLRADDTTATVTIADNGNGVSESIIDHIFDPYFTTKAESAGVGLYMAKGLIEGQMHGAMSVANSEDSGAVVTLSVPVSSGVPSTG